MGSFCLKETSPYISYVELIAVSADVDAAHDIAEGRYDIAEAELDSTLISSLGSINGSSELEGDAVSFASRGRDLYCYVGFNTQRVGVTGEDAQSVALRRAIGILLWYYAPSSVSGFLGDSAGGAYYPIADSNKISVISEIYGKNAEGNDIYTANMSAGDSASAASKAAVRVQRARRLSGICLRQALLLTGEAKKSSLPLRALGLNMIF